MTDTHHEREFFAYPHAFGVLASIAREHAPEEFIRTGTIIDTSCSSTLRGLSYLGWALANVPKEDRDQNQFDNAMVTIAEISALMGRILDFQIDAENLASFREHQMTAATSSAA